MKQSRFSLLILLFAALLGVFIFLSLNKSKNQPQKVIWADAEGYYMYLPGTFIYDWKEMPTRTTGWPNIEDRTFTKFTNGVAMLQAPIWCTGRFTARLFGFDSDGFSYLDGLLVTCSTIIYFLLGLFLLFQVLSQRYGRGLIILSFLLVLTGTNLYFYLVSESGMSHVYSFFTFCLIIFLTDRYWAKPSLGLTWALGFAFALTVLIRPTNMIVLLWIIGYDAFDRREVAERLNHFVKKWWRIPILLASGILVFLPQLCYWKMLTGNWIFYSYGDEGFTNWASPKMLAVLTHLENGLLLYSPILIAVLVGLVMMARSNDRNGRLILILFLLATYIFGSWWDWNFGGAFGHRCYVEYYAILIFPFCYLLQRIWQTKNRRLHIFVGIVILACVVYSLQMTYMYASPWDGPEWTWAEYLMRLKRAFWISP